MRAGWMRAWPAVAAGVLVALSLAHGLSGRTTFVYRDLGTQFHPVIEEARRGAGGGVDLIPMWTHGSSQGRPLAENAGFAFLAPLSLLWLFLPHAMAFDVFLLAHAVLGAAGMTVLARRLGLSAEGALAAGACLGLGGGVVSAFNLYWALVALGWAPWVLLAGVAACERPTLRAVAWLALALGMQANGGMPEVILCTLLVGGALSLAVATGPAWRRVLTVAVAWGAGGLWGIAIAAPQLVPAAAHASHTIRAMGFTTQGLLYNSLDPRALPGLAWPRWGGNPAEAFLPGGFPGAAWTDSGSPYLMSHYCGLAFVALAVLAVVLSCRWRAADPTRAVVLSLACVAVLGVVVALGRHAAPVRALAEAIPAPPLRFTVKALFATFLAIALLAGFGLDAIAARSGAGPRRRRIALALALAGAFDLMLAHRGFFPVMDVAERSAPPLVRQLDLRAAELGVAAGQWHLHHQRFPRGEWGPPPGSLALTPEAHHQWQRQMLMSPTGLPHGVRYAFDRLGDMLEDQRYFEETRRIYALPPPEWAKALGESGVLFVISPLDDLAEQTGNVLLLDRALDESAGVPAGSGFLYRNQAFRPRFEFTRVGKGEASVEAWSEDHGGLSVVTRSIDTSRLVLRVALGEFSEWRVTLDGRVDLPLEREGGVFAAVVVPSGEHAVRLERAPRTWRQSFVASVAGLLLAGVAIARGRRRERQPAAGVGPAVTA